MPRTAGQIFMGIIFILFGIAGFGLTMSFPGNMMGSGLSLFAILVPAIPIVIGIYLILGGSLPNQMGWQWQERRGEPVVVQEKVIVKVRCQYCGALYDETLDKCPNCGGSR